MGKFLGCAGACVALSLLLAGCEDAGSAVAPVPEVSTGAKSATSAASVPPWVPRAAPRPVRADKPTPVTTTRQSTPAAPSPTPGTSAPPTPHTQAPTRDRVAPVPAPPKRRQPAAAPTVRKKKGGAQGASRSKDVFRGPVVDGKLILPPGVPTLPSRAPNLAQEVLDDLEKHLG